MNQPIDPRGLLGFVEPIDQGPPQSPPSPTQSQTEAWILEQTSGAAVLRVCAGEGLKNFAQPGGFKAYRDNILAGCGCKDDPLEKLLLDQLLWAHHRIGELHTAAATSGPVEGASLYSAAAARLMAEFRKTVQALREYRIPVAPRQLTVVQQQNLAAGDQQVAYINGKADRVPVPQDTLDSRLTSNPQEAIAYESPTVFSPESASRGRREKESLEAGATLPGGPSTSPRGRAGQSPLAARHGAENARRKGTLRKKR